MMEKVMATDTKFEKKRLLTDESLNLMLFIAPLHSDLFTILHKWTYTQIPVALGDRCVYLCSTCVADSNMSH